jgi:DMSO reductase anchor subunit
VKSTTILQAGLQHVWGWPGIANFFLVGAGTGFYLVNFLEGMLHNESSALSQHVPLGLLGPVLAILGFLALTTEAGQPMRGVHLFRHLRHAWLSRETLCWTLFVLSAILNWWIPRLFFQIIAVPAALVLMISQGFILYQMRAITTWNVPLMPLFFISSGFMSGSGVVMLIGGLTRSLLPLSAIIIGIVALSANLCVWFLYLHSCRNTEFLKATEKLRRPFMAVTIVGLGHILPLVLLFLLVSGRTGGTWLSIVGIVSGLAMLYGVFLQKKAIVSRASYMKEITIKPSTE